MDSEEEKIIKSEIECFLHELELYCKKKSITVNKVDIDFFSFISKQIIFLKYLCLYEEEHCAKVLISDYYCLIVSILKNETRYIYFHERSIIENYMRLILRGKVEKNHIVNDLFEELKIMVPKLLSQKYGIVKSEYNNSCNHVHGGDYVKESLVFYFKDFINEKLVTNRNNLYDKLYTIAKFYNTILVEQRTDYIDAAFHRKKYLLNYLLGKDVVEHFFEIKEKIGAAK